MKDYDLLGVVEMEASILPSEDSVARSVLDLHFGLYPREEAVNWKLCTSRYFEAFSCCAPS